MGPGEPEYEPGSDPTESVHSAEILPGETMKALTHLTILAVLTFLTTLSASAQTAFNVTGITDKATYSDTVTISVTVEGGYTYALYLNGTNVSAGGAYTIRNADFYLVEAFRTNNT